MALIWPLCSISVDLGTVLGKLAGAALPLRSQGGRSPHSEEYHITLMGPPSVVRSWPLYSYIGR